MRYFVISLKKVWIVAIFLGLLTVGTIGYKGTHATPSLVRTPGTFYMVDTKEKVVALTFDDGPDPLYTNKILEILKAENIKATFFILGKNAQLNPFILNNIVSEGHEIGNHGYSHDYHANMFINELIETDEVIFEIAKLHPHYYRPPGGLVPKGFVQSVMKNGYIITLWSIDSKDWQNPGADKITRNVVKYIFPGAIILLHDGGDGREQTIKALPDIIQTLKKEGYHFITLSQLLQLKDDSVKVKS
jgi:peptidoglycan/xylan/chitin deacetylase (PgdA/CDA1 family)